MQSNRPIVIISRRPAWRLAIWLAAIIVSRSVGSPTDDGLALCKSQKYAEARAKLEAVVAAEPQNAAACLYLAQTLEFQTPGKAGLDAGEPWAEKAAKVAPKDAAILIGYSQFCFDLAEAHSSLTAALRGRDALLKAIELRPDDTAAREQLYQFYRQAPWPVGSSSKAAAQLEEIRRRNPEEAAVIAIGGQITAKDFAGAMKAAEALLQKYPNSSEALYMYGRAAGAAGQTPQLALERLKRCLTLPLDADGSPEPFKVWYWIGKVNEHLGKLPEARSAYETVLKLAPNNRPAHAALDQAKFK